MPGNGYSYGNHGHLPPYKKYQCRYYDDNGKALIPSCRAGQDCRFVHPTDPGWPGVRHNKGPLPPHRRPDEQLKRDSIDANRIPLPPRHDLFGRPPKQEDPDDSLLLRKSDNKRSEERNSRYSRQESVPTSQTSRMEGQSRSGPGPSSSYPTGPGSAQKSSSNHADVGRDRHMSIDSPAQQRRQSPSRHQSPPPRSGGSPSRGRPALNENHIGRDSTSISRALWTTTNGSSSHMPPPLIHPPPSKPAADRRADATGSASRDIVDIFRSMAKSSSDAFELTSEFERQDKKLKTYSEISQTLSKVSHSAAQSVAPNLAEILLNHGQLKARLAASLDGVGHLWDEIFARVNKEVNYIIEQQVEKAKGIIAQEVDRAIQSAAHNELQHQRDANHAPKRVRDDEDGYDREKRRRLNSWESPAVPQVQQNATAGTTDVLQQMQTMITQSLASIQSLTQENQELKIRSSSKAPPTGPSAKRDPSPFSSNDRSKYRTDHAGESRYGRGGSPPREPSSRDHRHARGRSYDKYEKYDNKPNGYTW